MKYKRTLSEKSSRNACRPGLQEHINHCHHASIFALQATTHPCLQRCPHGIQQIFTVQIGEEGVRLGQGMCRVHRHTGLGGRNERGEEGNVTKESYGGSTGDPVGTKEEEEEAKEEKQVGKRKKRALLSSQACHWQEKKRKVMRRKPSFQAATKREAWKRSASCLESFNQFHAVTV